MKLVILYAVIGAAWLGYSKFKKISLLDPNQNKILDLVVNLLAWPVGLGLYIKSLVSKPKV